MNNIYWRIGALVAYIAMVTTNYLAVLLPIGGRTTGEIADKYSNLFAPAGYAFSIWGVIYMLLGIYVIYQLTQKAKPILRKINTVFIINALFNCAWIFAWHYDIVWLSLILIVGILTTLIRIADTLRSETIPTLDRWLVKVPFSIYFGWITVATIANVTILLVSLNWNGFGVAPSIWTMIVLLVGAAIGCWRLTIDRCAAYGLVLIWAYSAILYKHLSPTFFARTYPEIIWTTSICIVVFIATILFVLFKKEK